MKDAKCEIGIKYFKNKNEIILIGGYNRNDKEMSRSFSMFDIMKNEFIEYPKTSQKHEFYPGIIIENNNLIYVIGNNGTDYNSKDSPFGVIECFDIRDKRWFEIDNLIKIFDSSFFSFFNNEKRYFRSVLNSI